MRLPLALLLALVLSGCAGMESLKDAYSGIGEYFGGKDNAEPPKELTELENKVKVSELWSASIGDGYDGQFLSLVPAVAEDLVFAADHKGELQARRRLDGQAAWTIDTELAISAGPAVGRDVVVVGTSNAEVAAFSRTDGSQVWKTMVSSEVLAPPQIESGLVIVRSSDGRIVGLDEKTGGTRWTYERTVPPLSLRSHGAPLVTSERVIDGHGSGKLIALHLDDGKPEWESTVALSHGRSEIERLVDVDATPVIKGDTIYVTGYNGGVASVTLRDGEVMWRNEKISSYTGLAANRRELFVTDLNSDVWQLDMRNGGDLWKQADLHQRRLTAPAVIKNYLAVGDFEGYLHILSQDDGSLLARIRVDDSAIDETPVVFDDVLYIYTTDGKLVAVSVE